jgi:gliding motility-associated-like protein
VNACKNSVVTFEGLPIEGTISKWTWNFDDGSTSNDALTTHYYGEDGVFPVRLSVLSSSGCSSDTVTKPISIYASFAFAGNDTVATRNQPIQLGATGGLSYEWSPATGLSNSLVSNPVAIINQDQQYILKAFTPAGCISYDTLNIRIFDGPEIYVPRAFTPNGDGLNDFLKAIPVGYKTFTSFTVYNRYGEAVYAAQASTGGWNGQVRGKAQNAGSYTWIASAITFAGKIIYKKGTVLLLR